MKNEIDALLQRKMDRKAFIKHVGIGFIALSGVAALVKSLTSGGGTTSSGTTNNASYGASVYGGNKK